MKKYWLHFKTVIKHKWYVFQVCCQFGLVWRGITHDLSKFSFSEFLSSARYFQGNSSPIDAEKRERGYSIAWMNHKGHNTHHWQYWIDNIGKEFVPVKMPLNDVLELIADWVGAGKAYNKEKWTEEEPLNYWNKNKDKVLLHPETYHFIEQCLLLIATYGLEYGIKIIKTKKY